MIIGNLEQLSGNLIFFCPWEGLLQRHRRPGTQYELRSHHLPSSCGLRHSSFLLFPGFLGKKRNNKSKRSLIDIIQVSFKLHLKFHVVVSTQISDSDLLRPAAHIWLSLTQSRPSFCSVVIYIVELQRKIMLKLIGSWRLVFINDNQTTKKINMSIRKVFVDLTQGEMGETDFSFWHLHPSS